MSLPEFNDSGDLPIGIHQTSLNEALSRFGNASDRRKLLSMRLKRIYKLAVNTGHVCRFVVFGSFVTRKPSPNDVDVFMIMDDDFDLATLSGESKELFSDHRAAQDQFGASVFWMRRLAAIGGEQSAIEDWQIKRDGTERGIIEITVE